MAALTADRILSGSESGPYGSMMRGYEENSVNRILL